MIKTILRWILILLTVLFLVILLKKITFSSRQLVVEPIEKMDIPDSLVQRLSQAIIPPTVSSAGYVDTLAFRQLDSAFLRLFPEVHASLDFKRINEFSRVYHWPGSDESLDPILLIAHLDVVPVELGSEDRWTYPPYSGAIEEGYIWGRGTLDDKMSAIALLEAVTLLLEADFVPKRNVYIAFGHDEETSGEKGAGSIASYFEEEGLHFDFVLDEGLVILEEALDGLEQPLAMIGIAEKGICTINLSVDLEEGGHSSMPPPQTAVGILASAIDKLQSNPFPAKLDGAVNEFFNYVGPEIDGPLGWVMANRWLTSGLLISQLEKDPAANALLRTTTAPTMVRGGIRPNVLPTRTSAKVNFRIIPGESVASTLAYCKDVIDDPRVRITLDSTGSFYDPSPVSDSDAFGFQIIQRTTLEVYPDVVVAPSLVIAFTDSRHYHDIANQVYRFCPVQINRADLKRIHGTDERISVENYRQMIRFYHQLISKGCG